MGIAEDTWRAAWEAQQRAYRDLADGEQTAAPSSLSSTPVHPSDALAVHPRQVREAAARDRLHGVPTEYLTDGRPVIRSRAHQKALLRSLKMHNRDGGYGD